MFVCFCRGGGSLQPPPHQGSLALGSGRDSAAGRAWIAPPGFWLFVPFCSFFKDIG